MEIERKKSVQESGWERGGGGRRIRHKLRQSDVERGGGV
jgi:hypothetical protein